LFRSGSGGPGSVGFQSLCSRLGELSCAAGSRIGRCPGIPRRRHRGRQFQAFRLLGAPANASRRPRGHSPLAPASGHAGRGCGGGGEGGGGRGASLCPAWLAELLPADAVRAWLVGIGLALVLLAVRGGWSDPERPYWSVGGVMAVSAIAAALAIWFRHQR